MLKGSFKVANPQNDRSKNIYISALASAPSRPPNPTLTPKTKLLPKKTRSKVPKTQKTGCAYSEHYTK